MMTLKLALLATTAAGAVAAAGGITYATVGSSSDAPSAQPAKNAAVATDHQRATQAPALPQLPAVPTCLPADLPRAEAIAKVKKQLKEITDKVSQLNGAASKITLPKVPIDKLPLCKAGTGGSTTPSHPPTVPGKPGIQVPAVVSCDIVPAVIKNEEARAKELTLPKGLHVGVAHAHSIVIKSRAACVYTQELIGGAGQLITVDRITTPPQVTLREVAASLKMPGNFVTVNGVDTWRSPVNNGMLWYSNKGYAIRVTGSNPVTAALVPVIASQLRLG
jgi:hypothetical protein